ncbi:hypothetical protein N0V93_005237 [Gnomoniopsis smithogilvyi]|uniref:DUF7729 domain-containing protein n=1 Tax=Gnomoniopsis smithogilvyi TaxID=1191159 RepID=A0A9W8YU06_9PEZI|nr:hypothetical protein N0V93_005237 [Gnomoniopsis smithogilvyi]
MIDAEDFQTCYPISLLLQGSNSFFEAEKSLVSISRVLDNACAANVTGCANYLANVASNLTKTENCGDDYDAGNPTVTEAYLGLISYQVVYSATCLKDDTSQSYCFGDAVTNTTNASQTYFYFLPLNSSLPGGVVPLCGTCLQDTMSIYHVATANRKQPIADTYASAAEMVDELCGADFANTTLAEAITTSGAFSTISQGPSMALLLTTLLAIAVNSLI